MVFGKKKLQRETKKISEGLFSAGVINAGFFAPYDSHDFMSSVASNSLAIDYAIFHNYDFPFTNLVFEGGGIKGLAYVGVLQVLENAGILDNIVRVCGASVGSLAALLVYVGYSPDEIKDIMSDNPAHVLRDHKCGYCSLVPGLIKHFGWNPGRRLEKWLKKRVREKLGDGNYTFKQAYEKTGKEFCVVVTNLNRMETEYFHVKTTPDISIAFAVAMSMSIPGYLQPRKIHKGNVTDYYIDGGLLCNYPIHAFDGWWLSMKPEDSFFKKMSDIDNVATDYSTRFREWNPETVGMLLYAEDEIEIMKNIFRSRQGADLPKASKYSKMYNRKRKKARHREEEMKNEEEAIVDSIRLLMKIINDIELPSTGCIPLMLLKDGLEKSPDFTKIELSILFGCDSIDEAVEEMDVNDDGQISYFELVRFIESKGIDLYSRVLGYSRREISSFSDFVSAIEEINVIFETGTIESYQRTSHSGLSVSLLRSYVENKDAERTIGVNTGYIETTDFKVEDYDKVYLLECGREAARAYLREFCRNNHHRRRRSSRELSLQFFKRLRRQSDVTEGFMDIVEKESQRMADNPDYFPSVFSTIEEEEDEEDEGGGGGGGGEAGGGGGGGGEAGGGGEEEEKEEKEGEGGEEAGGGGGGGGEEVVEYVVEYVVKNNVNNVKNF